MPKKTFGAGQRELVRDLMLDGKWRSLQEIADNVDHPEASISARLRDLRKAEFGGFTVTRRYEAGVHEYRVEA